MMATGSGLPLCLSGIGHHWTAKGACTFHSALRLGLQMQCRVSMKVRLMKKSLRPCSQSNDQRNLTVRRGVISNAPSLAVSNATSSHKFSLSASGDVCKDARGRHETLTAAPATCEESEAILEGPRFAVAQEMAELDRRRLAIRERRSIQGLEDSLVDQMISGMGPHRRAQDIIRVGLQELPPGESETTSFWPGSCGAKAA